MGLQVWMQFNEDGRNKGLCNVNTKPLSDAKFAKNGKVGGCLETVSDSAGVSLEEYMSICSQYTNYTMCAWVFLKQRATGHSASIVSTGNWNYSKSQCTFGFYDYSDGYRILIVPNRDSCVGGVRLPEKIGLNKWYHVSVTYDGNKSRCYLNGIYFGSYNGGGITNTSNSNNLYIGRATYYSGFTLRGKISDLRIYDECLSDKEIRDISKGLMAHYRLSDNINIMQNVFKYPTFNTASQGSGWNHWGASGHKGAYGQNTDKKYIFNKQQTYSHWVENGADATATYLVYQYPEFDGGYRSLCAIIKEKNGLKIDKKICYPGWNSNSGVVPKDRWTSIEHLGDGFYLCKCEGLQQSGENDLIGINVCAGYKIYISECYVENNRKICSDILYHNIEIEKDVSGFGNDAYIKSTSLEVDLDTARYHKSYFWPVVSSSTNVISSNTLYFDGVGITMSVWVKFVGENGGGSYHMPLESGYYGKYEMSISPDGKLRAGIYVNGTRYVNNCANPSMYDKKWHLIAMSYDGEVIRRYVDGVEYVKTNVVGIADNKQDYFCMGQYGNSASYYNRGVYESDARIYATALHPGEIKQLYETGAMIDNKNDILSYEFNENSENLLRYELTIKNSRKTETTCGKWTKRNNINSMVFLPTDYYFGSGNKENGKLLLNEFKENTPYIFDIWLDTDDVYTENSGNQEGGFVIFYTDGSRDYIIKKGDYKNKKGFQHIIKITSKDKTIKSLSVYYWGNFNIFTRWDSSITEYTQQNIKKTGVFNGGVFKESIDTNENAKIYKGGIVKGKRLEKI